MTSIQTETIVVFATDVVAYYALSRKIMPKLDRYPTWFKLLAGFIGATAIALLGLVALVHANKESGAVIAGVAFLGIALFLSLISRTIMRRLLR